MLHLRQMLENQYEEIKNESSKSLVKNERISGYMEAGLISSLVNRVELKQVINESHKKVFGLTFDERSNAEQESKDVWDVPTWIRRGVELGDL